jgi:hypothetical protein
MTAASGSPGWHCAETAGAVDQRQGRPPAPVVRVLLRVARGSAKLIGTLDLRRNPAATLDESAVVRDHAQVDEMDVAVGGGPIGGGPLTDDLPPTRETSSSRTRIHVRT